MAEYKYDEEAPFVVAYSSGDKARARFRSISDAARFIDHFMTEGIILDTTPKPRIPADVHFITWSEKDEDDEGYDWYARRTTLEGKWEDNDGLEMNNEYLLRRIGDKKITYLKAVGGEA